MKQVLIVLMILIYLINIFTDQKSISFSLSLVSFIILVISFYGGQYLSRNISLILIVITILLSFVYKMDWQIVYYGIQQNIPILSLILMAPLITIPLKLSGYLNSVINVLNSFRHNTVKAYSGVMLFLFIVSPVLNIGSVRLTHEIVRDIGFTKKFLGKAYVTGYTSAIVWSPYFASIATVLYMLEVPLSKYIIFGILLGFIQISISVIIFYFNHDKVLSQNHYDESIVGNLKNDWFNIYKLFTLIILLIGALVFIERITEIEMITIIILSAIIIPFLWGLLTNNIKNIIGEMKKVTSTFNNSNSEVILFLSAGLLASVMSQTTLNDMLTPFFVTLAEYSYILLIIVIIFLILFLTLIGLHQIVVIPLIILQTPPEAVGIPPLALAFVFILGWSLSVVTSPISLTNLLVSNLLNSKWWVVGFKWNGLYIFILFIIGSFISIVLINTL